MDANDFSRIDKLFVDRDEMAPDASLAARSACSLHIVCGPEVITSATARAAALTALRTAQRCYPGGVSLQASAEVRLALLSDGDLTESSGRQVLSEPENACTARYVIAIGTVDAIPGSLQVSFDGWTAQVDRGAHTRLPERDLCPLSGVLAGALAVSETFMDYAGIAPEATRRRVRLSLWDPAAKEPDIGPELRYLPSPVWLAGLGHLGQAYAWAWSLLPFGPAAETELWLLDDDKVAKANVETGILCREADVGAYKTRMVSAWLESRGFPTRILERRIDASFAVGRLEPKLILGGFDSNLARQHLAGAYTALIDAGLGSRADNFDTIVVRAFPNPRPVNELWPAGTAQVDLVNRLAEANPAYAKLEADACGRVRLAERAVGVPFVGAVAAVFAWANVLRDLHGGVHITDLKLKLSAPTEIEVHTWAATAQSLAKIAYVDAGPLRARS